MKHKTLILEIFVYALIVGFLIIPPFFTPALTSDSLLFDWSFPIKQLFLCIFALILYFITDPYIRTSNTKYPYPFSIMGWSFPVVLVIVFLISRQYAVPKAALYPPLEGTHRFINFILTFLCSAIYEEMIYRFYFPGETIRLLLMKWDSKFFVFLGELLGAVAFSFAHLYLGWSSVIVAFFAHFFFRWFYKITGLIWNCIIIHFVYNIIVWILS